MALYVATSICHHLPSSAIIIHHLPSSAIIMHIIIKIIIIIIMIPATRNSFFNTKPSYF